MIHCSHGTQGLCQRCVQAEIDRAYLEAQRRAAQLESDTIAALRAKLEQAERTIAELTNQRDAYLDERDRWHNNHIAAEARVRELESLPLCGEHMKFSQSHDGECFGCDRDRLQRVVDAFMAWLPTRRNAPDWTTIAMIEAKLDALLREGK